MGRHIDRPFLFWFGIVVSDFLFADLFELNIISVSVVRSVDRKHSFTSGLVGVPDCVRRSTIRILPSDPEAYLCGQAAIL